MRNIHLRCNPHAKGHCLVDCQNGMDVKSALCIEGRQSSVYVASMGFKALHKQHCIFQTNFEPLTKHWMHYVCCITQSTVCRQSTEGVKLYTDKLGRLS